MIGMPFVYDDGGRAVAGFRGDANDCVTRAIAIATEQPYADVYNALHDRAKQTGAVGQHASPREGVHRRICDHYLNALGWTWVATMAIGSGCQVHLRADELPAGRLIVRVSKHLCTVIDGVVHDTHDPSRDGTRCVYGYWTTDPA